MEYQLIKKQDITQKVKITLSMGMLKILHNACLDILHEHPEAIVYNAALEELQEIILNQENKQNETKNVQATTR